MANEVITKQEVIACGKCQHHCNNALLTLEVLEQLQDVYDGIGEIVRSMRERYEYMTKGSQIILDTARALNT